MRGAFEAFSFSRCDAMPETGDCPNGLCARKPTGAAADSYGNRPAGQTATAVFALG